MFNYPIQNIYLLNVLRKNLTIFYNTKIIYCTNMNNKVTFDAIYYVITYTIITFSYSSDSYLIVFNL